MIGQNSLKTLVNSFTVESFPTSILLVGEQGCGKHTFVNDVIRPYLNNPVSDITSEISFESLLDIALNTVPTIYCVNIDSITEKQQNILLKFLEEPPVTARIVLMTSLIANVIPTIQNRCVQWFFDNYTDEELMNFTSDCSLLKYIRSPGKLKTTTVGDISNIETLCNKLFQEARKASLSNLLSVSDRISWSDKIAGYDKDIFYDVLLKSCADLFKQGKVSILSYKLTDDYVNKFKSKLQFDRKRMFEKYLVELKYGCNQ